VSASYWVPASSLETVMVPGYRVGGQEAEIEQGVDVGPQQQPVGAGVGVRAAVGAQVGCFQGRRGVTAGDGTSSLVGLQERGPEAGLPTAGHDLPVDPKTGIVIVIQALAAGGVSCSSSARAVASRTSLTGSMTGSAGGSRLSKKKYPSDHRTGWARPSTSYWLRRPAGASSRSTPTGTRSAMHRIRPLFVNIVSPVSWVGALLVIGQQPAAPACRDRHAVSEGAVQVDPDAERVRQVPGFVGPTPWAWRPAAG
jgi:hypothetical protein